MACSRVVVFQVGPAQVEDGPKGYRSGSSGGLGQVGWSHKVIHLGLLSQRPNSSAHHQVMPSGCRLEAWVMFQQEDGDGPPFSWWESPGPLRCTGQSRASPHLPLSSSQE